MRPTQAGEYTAREITYGFGGGRLLSAPVKVKVVEGAPNPRGHALLIETGMRTPKYKSLDCYEWGPPDDQG